MHELSKHLGSIPSDHIVKVAIQRQVFAICFRSDLIRSGLRRSCRLLPRNIDVERTQRGHDILGKQLLGGHHLVMRQIANVEHPQEVAISRNLHIVFQPTSDIIRIAAHDEAIFPHLLKRRMRSGEVAFDPLAMLE